MERDFDPWPCTVVPGACRRDLSEAGGPGAGRLDELSGSSGSGGGCMCSVNEPSNRIS